ncbi:HEAT repeat domain-containing protein [Streptomyces sp. NBC_01768]|uniref:HEAT repeat domain-containing protein n=1 Tax=Streptomyces sp. NBC_01768 TaxID=2975938 RepID=UPI002DD8E5D8|nr:HEAT repeat domain-containing protein [Streptomyces sp. NBC_01768]WSC29618.1 HEAT repeat domain-containing protein [Streptomyces sp. NBC_01768]
MDASIDSGAVAGAGEGAGVVAVTPPAPPPASEVISAVRAGDAHGVEALLSAGADPDARDEHGTPVLCLAIETYAVEVVRLLATHGADPDRCGPDGVRPLRKAVDSGSPAVAGATVHNTAEWRHHREAELLEARSLARNWYETGVEAELRRRTGAQGAVARTHVQDDEYTGVDEFSLGGATVRDGHAAILTDLEKALGLRPPFEELLERALTRPDQRHATWAASTLLLSHRRDQETWDAAAALSADPDPVHRLFGTEVLRLTHLFDESEEDRFAAPTLELFLNRSAQEQDAAVLTELLTGLAEHADPRGDERLLSCAGHPDPRVRHAVAFGFDRWAPAFSAAVRKALVDLMADPDADVRQGACRTVADSKDRAPELAEAMAALLDDTSRPVRVSAVHGLARHDDERCVEGARRLPPAPPGTSYEYDLDEVWRYERRRDGR